MIVKMKKITLVGLKKKEENLLTELKELGVIHVEHIKKPDSEKLSALYKDNDIFNKVISFLETLKSNLNFKESDTPIQIAKDILKILEDKASLEERIINFEKEIERIKPIGHFSINDIKELIENGLFVKFYSISKKDLSNISNEIKYNIISSNKNTIIILIIDKKNHELEYEEFIMPKISLKDLEAEVKASNEKIDIIKAKLLELKSYLPSLKKYKKKIESDIEYNENLFGMGVDDNLSYLKGFCPIDEIEKLKEKTKELETAIIVEDPKEIDDAPTLLKNPSWIKIIDPVLKFMNTTPGYGEYDVSLWFLVSLTIFFAMLIGDGGYGIIYLILSLFLHKKFSNLPKEPFILFYTFSVSTIIWGLITGTWFGAEYFSTFPIIRDLIIPKLNSFSNNSTTIMSISFAIGIIHLTIAHIWRIIRAFPSFIAVSQVGWIIMIWYLYYLVNYLVLGKALPNIMIFVVGVSIAFIFSSIKKFTFETLIVHVISFVLNIISSFGDIVSYIRLFAVGAASLAIAISTNQMAMMFGFDGFTNTLISVLILFAGHALNFVLGALAVIVHGVRLNMLEFSNHLEMTWAGRLFTPFKKNK